MVTVFGDFDGIFAKRRKPAPYLGWLRHHTSTVCAVLLLPSLALISFALREVAAMRACDGETNLTLTDGGLLVRLLCVCFWLNCHRSTVRHGHRRFDDRNFDRARCIQTETALSVPRACESAMKM